MRKLGLVLLPVLFLLMTACSSAPPPSKSASSPSAAEPVAKQDPTFITGKACFTRMLDQAHRWSADALPVHAESALNEESLGHDGKSTVWKGMFVSPSRGMLKTFSCSGSRLVNEPPVGISASPEYASPAAVPMFDPSYLVTDSDKAFALAQDKGGAKLLQQDPKQPVFYLLDWDSGRKQLVWVIVYGKAVKDSKGIGVIDASTGKFLRASK